MDSDTHHDNSAGDPALVIRTWSTQVNLQLLLDDLQRLYGWPDDPWIEHAMAEPSFGLEHEMLLTIPPQAAFPRLVVFHRLGCGCDALTDELVLHG